MHCGKCDNNLVDCVCEDLEERLKDLAAHPNLAMFTPEVVEKLVKRNKENRERLKRESN